MKITVQITPLSITEPSQSDSAKGIKSLVNVLIEEEKKGIKQSIVLTLKSNVQLDPKTYLNKLTNCEVEYPKAYSLSQYSNPLINWKILSAKLA